MSIIHDENFDGVTPPAMPSGWTVYSAKTTSSPTGVTPTSGANVAELTGIVSSTIFYQTYQTADSNGGNVSVQCNFATPSFSATAQAFGLMARGSGNDLHSGSATFYHAVLDTFANTFSIAKVISGTRTSLASISVSGLATDVWYQVVFTLSGTGLSGTVQRLSDNYWLGSSGTFQSTAATALNLTDSAISGAGYAGFSLQSYGRDAYADDWIFATAASPTAATITVTDGADAGSIAGSEESAILTRLETADFPAIPGTSGMPAAAAVAESADAPIVFGGFKAGVLAVSDGGDVPAIAGGLETAAAPAATETGDRAAATGQVHNSVTMAATGGNDTPAIAGTATSSAAARPVEGHDVAAIVGTGTATSGSTAAAETRDRAAIAAVSLAPPPAANVREAGDVAGFAGSTPGLHYNIYINDGMDGPIDYSNPIAVTGSTTWSSAPLGCPGVWSFGVRPTDPYGEEDNLDCAVTITLSAAETDLTNVPQPPIGLRAIATAASGIRVEWAYPQVGLGGRVPTGFRVYTGTGAAPSYAAPAATVAFGTAIQGRYRANLAGLSSGTSYAVAVRAYSAVGEETNQTVVTATASGAGPASVAALVSSAVV